MTAETIHTCSYACERPECIRAQRDELASRVAAETSNAREWPERYACNGPEGTFWTDDAALAQQPAAVDEAFVTRLADALIAKGWDVDPDCDGSGIVQLREAVIATQHQEPTTCKHDFRRDEDNGGECCQLCGEVKP